MMQIITPAERLAERHGVHALKTSEPLQPKRKYHDAELSRRWQSFLMVFPGSSACLVQCITAVLPRTSRTGLLRIVNLSINATDSFGLL